MSNPRSNQQLSVKLLLQIDSICDRFEGALRSGEAKPIDACLQALSGPSRQLALRELLMLEIGYRVRAGERPALEEYLVRYPDDRDVVILAFADVGNTAEKAAEDETCTFQPARSPQNRTMETSPESSTRKPRSVSLGQVTKWLVESELMTAADVEEFINTLPPAKCDGKRAIEEMYRQGKLTKFQAQTIFQGKTRGLVVGNYIVLDRLGKGGMGYVYKARHRTMKRIVALKVLPSSAVSSPEAVKRFRREVEAVARLRHANIVSAFDASEARGIHYLVMECIEGEDLRALVKDHGPLPPRLAVDCILQAARGLAYAHSQGVIHRDIKPGNLMLDGAGRVLVLDLGLAKFEFAAQMEANADCEELTRDGQLMGTPDFMSPEQAFDTRDADARSDIYSLGCTLYYLIAGKSPYTADTQFKKVLAHRNDPVPSLAAAAGDVPPALDAIFQRMTAKDPWQRQQTMAEVVAELKECLRTLDESGAAVETMPFAARENEVEDEASDQKSFLDVPLAMPSRLWKADTVRSAVNWGGLVRKALLGIAAVFAALLAVHWLTSRQIVPVSLVVRTENGAVVRVVKPGGEILVEAVAGKDAMSFSLPPGRYDVAVRKDGKHDFDQQVVLEAGGPLVVNANLEELAREKPRLWPALVRPLLERASSALATLWQHRRQAADVAIAAADAVGGCMDRLRASLDSSQWTVMWRLNLQPLANWRPVVKTEVGPPIDVASPTKIEPMEVPPIEPLKAKPDTTHREITHSVADYFEVRDLTLEHARYPVGQELHFTYDLANVAKRDVNVPAGAGKGGVNQYILAARQHWIERLDGLAEIAVLDEGHFRKTNKRYRVTEILLVNEGKTTPLRVSQGGKLPCEGLLLTAGFPTGKYRYTVELHGLRSGTVVSKQELEFEIIAP